MQQFLARPEQRNGKDGFDEGEVVLGSEQWQPGGRKGRTARELVVVRWLRVVRVVRGNPRW